MLTLQQLLGLMKCNHSCFFKR